ncbi:hypothetical protein C8R43DRAFT_1204751, partial [Mycena crocata]
MLKTKRSKTKKGDAAPLTNFVSRSISKIPTEIWQEIVSSSNFPVLSKKCDASRSLLLLGRCKTESAPKTIPDEYRERPEILRALSQTCRRFRVIFLPLLWENVEAYFESKDGSSWNIRVSDVLLDRCRGLMKRENQSLARYVRVFSVSISSYRIGTVMRAFARCLRSLPNLRTLHILHLKNKWIDEVSIAFMGVQVHTVRTIILPSNAYPILAACPNVRDISCNEEDGATLFETMMGCCPKVQRIDGFKLCSSRLKSLLK